MNTSRLALFRAAATSFAQKRLAPARKLYTDSIYPYPFNYANSKYPSLHCYRETYKQAPWQPSDDRYAWWIMRIFWTGFFYQLFHNPGAILGHFDPPDPALWTDAELGIPPLDSGSYVDWLDQKSQQ